MALAVQARISPFTAMTKALSAFKVSSSGTSRPTLASVQLQLDAAKPVEKQWEYDDFINAGSTNIRLCMAQQHGDGVWKCCCRHENYLTHYSGAYPFKYLTCGKCSHILCACCETTEILTPVRLTNGKVSLGSVNPNWKVAAARYCRVCSNCGLSHHAETQTDHLDYFSPLCPCGHPTVDEGRLYYIGTVDEWRRDPHGQAVGLGYRRINAAM
ncbi:hypothetical protein GQ44DRAFT_578493, partial [Phaeosphaeriaceae sp. PMI808]